jgi:hypothetical protein
MQKAGQYDILAPKDNNLLGRPSTAGSLKPRSSSGQRPGSSSVKKHEEPESSPIRPRIFKYRSSSSHSRRDEQTLPEKIRKQVDEKPDDFEEKPENLETQKKDDEEELDAVKDLPEKVEDGLSHITGVTTSSQRRYILELEGMLRQEKLKRIQIEETLKQVLDNKD